MYVYKNGVIISLMACEAKQDMQPDTVNSDVIKLIVPIAVGYNVLWYKPAPRCTVTSDIGLTSFIYHVSIDQLSEGEPIAEFVNGGKEPVLHVFYVVAG